MIDSTYSVAEPPNFTGIVQCKPYIIFKQTSKIFQGCLDKHKADKVGRKGREGGYAMSG
jgi:hypothetical protein